MTPQSLFALTQDGDHRGDTLLEHDRCLVLGASVVMRALLFF
jgi:hypothetical protein